MLPKLSPIVWAAIAVAAFLLWRRSRNPRNPDGTLKDWARAEIAAHPTARKGYHHFA
jgi:hypothetical protein